MKFQIVEKLIPTKFVVIDNIEFELLKLIGCLNQFLNKVDDNYCDYSFIDYELEYFLETKYLVELGLLKNYRGYHMSNLFCIKNEEAYKTMKTLLKKLYKIR